MKNECKGTKDKINDKKFYLNGAFGFSSKKERGKVFSS